MLTPIINVIVALVLAVSTAFGSLFAAFTPLAGSITVLPNGAVATVEPAATVAPLATEPKVGPLATATPAPASDYPIIQRGQSGEEVEQLQQRLIELGYYTGKLTGKMDSATQLAYKKFEKANGFNANGIASPEEQVVLYSEAAVKAE